MLNPIIDYYINNPLALTFTAVIITVVLNFTLAIPLINLLYKYRFYKTKDTKGIDTSKRNPLWYKHLGERLNVPSSYGITLIPNLIVLLILIKDPAVSGIIYFSLLFLALGLSDDVIKYYYFLKTKRWGIGAGSKLLVQFAITAIFLITALGLSNLPWVIFLLLFIVFFVNSYNITDGLDGLVSSISLLIFPTLIYLEYRTSQNINLIILLAVLMGFFLVFQYFNIKPARVMLGDVGTMAVGFILGALVLKYPVLPLIVLYMIIVIEGLSSALQIFSLKIFKKKAFTIAPLHLHLLNKGWEDTKIVQRAWLVQFILVVAALFLFELII